MKKDDTYKDKGLRVAVQHKNDEKPVQHRMKFWPWIAAACVAAFLVVLLAPPRKEAITEPQIAKVEPKTKSVEVKTAEPEERHLSQAISPIKRRKKRPKIEHPRSTDISTSEDEALPLTAEVIVPTAEKTMVSTSRPRVAPSVPQTDMAQATMMVIDDPAEQIQSEFKAQTESARQRGEQVMLHVAALSQQETDNYQIIEF